MDIDVTLLKGKIVYLEKLTPENLPVLKELARDETIWEFTKTLLINETFESQADSYLATALDTNALGGQQAHGRGQQRRLARTVGADHGDDLSRLQRQRDAAHCIHLPVGDVQVFDFEHGGHAPAPTATFSGGSCGGAAAAGATGPPR